MIDWDDFDWRKVAGAIILAILVIGGVVFVVNDNMTAKRLQTQLEGQLKALNDFQSIYQPPSAKDLDEMNSKLESLEADYDKLPLKLSTSVDTGALEKRIKDDASVNGVNLEKFEAQPESKDGFLVVYPYALNATGSNESLSKFLSSFSKLGVPWRYHNPPTNTEGRTEMVAEFLGFDKDGWDQAYSCNIAVTPPANLDVDVSKIKIFKGNLVNLKSDVDAFQVKLSDAKKTMDDRCALERQISGLEKEIKLSQDLAK